LILSLRQLEYLSIWSFPELINMEILNRLKVIDMFTVKNDLVIYFFLTENQLFVKDKE